MPHRILIMGFYGYNNTGDDVILHGMVNTLRREIPDVDLTVLSADPVQTERRYGVRSVFAGRRFSGLGILAKEMRRADLFILGGGGLLQDRERRIIPFWLSRVVLAKLLRRKVMFYAQGVGPIETGFGKALVRRIVNHVDLITVRDAASQDLLRSLGVTRPPVRLTADPACGIDRPDGAVGRRLLAAAGVFTDGTPLVGVSVRAWPGLPAAEIAAALDDVAARLACRLIFIPLQGESDVAAAEVIGAEMRHRTEAHVLRGSYEPLEVAAVLGQMTLVVGMRLHAVILAARQGVPCVSLAYDPKVAQFAARAGLGEYVCDLGGLRADAFAARVARLWADLPAARARLVTATEALARLAAENGRLAAQLLAE